MSWTVFSNRLFEQFTLKSPTTSSNTKVIIRNPGNEFNDNQSVGHNNPQKVIGLLTNVAASSKGFPFGSQTSFLINLVSEGGIRKFRCLHAKRCAVARGNDHGIYT
ncbi:hypothetical protein [Paenibacillus sp. TSA_86.1]|jgi:hypothetical protein|uniref:hypothetical protein n=1 Tax=Paenibacillus sp. TSA_86.1 TaxID=3415649 RepID=UPI0040468008